MVPHGRAGKPDVRVRAGNAEPAAEGRPRVHVALAISA